MSDDGDRSSQLPAAQSDDPEGAGAELGLHGELAAARHAIAARHRQLHRFPVRELEVPGRGDADVCPGGLDRGPGGRALSGREPRRRFRVPPRHPAAGQPRRAHHHDVLLDQRLGLQLRRGRETTDNPELGAVRTQRVHRLSRVSRHTFEQVEAFVKANPGRWMANPYVGAGTAVTLEHDLRRLHASDAGIGYLAYGGEADEPPSLIEGTSYFYRDGLEHTEEHATFQGLPRH